MDLDAGTPRAVPFNLADYVDYSDGSTVSKILLKKGTGNLTLFSLLLDNTKDLVGSQQNIGSRTKYCRNSGIEQFCIILGRNDTATDDNNVIGILTCQTLDYLGHECFMPRRLG